MDEQNTLSVDESFIGTIRELVTTKGKAELMLDVNNAIERASGVIVAFDDSKPDPAITLDNGQSINVSSITAINGLFKSDYICC